MKIEIIKAEMQEFEVGDVLTLGNPHEVKHYLLINHVNKDSVGAINLGTGTIEYLYNSQHGLEQVVSDILKENEWNEWTLVSKDKVKMSLDCRNNSPISKGISTEIGVNDDFL